MNKKGFTIVELMIGIVIFTIGIISVFGLISSSVNISVRIKEQVIASNLAREQLELIKNIRNSNWIKLQEWDDLKNYLIDLSPNKKIGDVLGGNDYIYLTIENNFDNNNPIIIKKINPSFSETKEQILDDNFEGKVYLNDKGIYTHVPGGKETKLRKYIKISKIKSFDKNKSDYIEIKESYRIDSYVVSLERGVTKYNVNSIITNWKKD